MRTAGLIAIFALFLSACPSGQYDELPDATAAERTATETLWREYQKQLADKALDKQPDRLARFFAGPLVAGLKAKDFQKQVQAARRKFNTGLFEAVKITAVKRSPQGLLMVIDSKAGEAGVPIVAEGGGMRFAALDAACGDFASPISWAQTDMPEKKSLIYLKMVIHDPSQPIGARLQGAVALAQSKYRKEIIKAQQSVEDPIVRLGLGLARIKIDGYDASFLREFPNAPQAISALQQADPAIFEEMVVKLTNMGSMVEDPPANETLYKAAAGAPDTLRDRFAKALYDMAEANPGRFVNAVFNLSKDMEHDAALAAFAAEAKKRDGAPKVKKFLSKFAREGEPAEREICKKLLQRFRG